LMHQTFTLAVNQRALLALSISICLNFFLERFLLFTCDVT